MTRPGDDGDCYDHRHLALERWRYLLGQIRGAPTLTAAQQLFADTAALMQTTGVSKILFDARYQGLALTTVDA